MGRVKSTQAKDPYILLMMEDAMDLLA